MPPSKNGIRVVLAAGGVVRRSTPEGVRVAVIRRTRYGEEWSLPKGKLEPGETFEEAAVREVREETACEAAIRAFVGAVDYLAKKKPKVCFFYDMELAAEGEFRPGDEVKQLLWVEPAEAVEMLTYGSEVQLMQRWIRLSSEPAESAP